MVLTVRIGFGCFSHPAQGDPVAVALRPPSTASGEVKKTSPTLWGDCNVTLEVSFGMIQALPHQRLGLASQGQSI